MSVSLQNVWTRLRKQLRISFTCAKSSKNPRAIVFFSLKWAALSLIPGTDPEINTVWSRTASKGCVDPFRFVQLKCSWLKKKKRVSKRKFQIRQKGQLCSSGKVCEEKNPYLALHLLLYTFWQLLHFLITNKSPSVCFASTILPRCFPFLIQNVHPKKYLHCASSVSSLVTEKDRLNTGHAKNTK